jgi:5-(carboxyamino)imidazole ribonucleotide synthase
VSDAPRSPQSTIGPGATIGVLGSGQLGRMLGLAARGLGYRVHTYSPDTDSPTGQIGDAEVTGRYDDLDALRAFAGRVDVVTFEFENIPSASVAAIAERALVRPAGSVLHTTQHRGREKSFLSGAGIPVAPYALVATADDLDAAVTRLGCPAILKTASFGYDGKGQARIDRAADAVATWDQIGRQPAVLEAFVDFERELSVVAARGADGRFAHYGLIENAHARHILDVSMAPARVPPEVEREAIAIARTTLEALDVVGVLCVELFLTRNGRVLVNELAPRTHNSGHLTIEAAATSQFEQQLRAVCGLPLGSTALLRPAAMANLLGDLWQEGEPRWADALGRPGIHLHLYGKGEAKLGRKMGHLTALAETPEAAAALVREARAALTESHVRA